MYIIAKIRPGPNAAMKSVPTGTCRRSPMMISMMLGGIRIPKVPAAQITPVASEA